MLPPSVTRTLRVGFWTEEPTMYGITKQMVKEGKAEIKYYF
jgi:hypothetical protein